MKHIVLSNVSALLGLLFTSCTTVTGKHNNVNNRGSGSCRDGRRVSYAQQVAVSNPNQCGGEQIVTYWRVENGVRRIVWRGPASQFPGYQGGDQQSGYSGRRGGPAGPGLFTGMIGGYMDYNDPNYPHGVWRTDRPHQ